MGDLVQDAAEAVLPLLASGASGAVKNLAERGGERLSAAVGTVLAKLRRRVRDGADRDEVEQALRAALADGELREADLTLLVQAGSVIAGNVQKTNVVINDSDIGTINVDTTFHVGRDLKL